MRLLCLLGTLLLLEGVPGCASTAQPIDLGALAARHGLDPARLELFVRGYGEGYDDGLARQAGVRAGTGHGNLPGPRGEGWVLGHREAIEGRPKRHTEELAAELAGGRR